MPIGTVRCGLTLMRRVYVELHRQPLGDKMLLGKAAHQFEPGLAADPGIGRQGHDDLARDLCVPALLGSFGGVPQHRRIGKPRGGTLGEQHLVVLGRVAMAEVGELAGTLGRDRCPRVVGRRAHSVAAAAARDVPGAGKLDRHAAMIAASRPVAKPTLPDVSATLAKSHSSECLLHLHA